MVDINFSITDHFLFRLKLFLGMIGDRLVSVVMFYGFAVPSLIFCWEKRWVYNRV